MIRMQFIKKNYEKVLLGLVLFGLVVTVAFLFVLVANERQAQAERREKVFRSPVKELPPPDVSWAETLIKRSTKPEVFAFAGDNTSSESKLFNPIRWQRLPTGDLVKNPAGSELAKLEVTEIAPLYLSITLETVSPSDSGVKYVVGSEQQASSVPAYRTKRRLLLSEGDRTEFPDRKNSLTLVRVEGETNNPSALILQLGDSTEPVTISREKAFRRVEGYTADLKLPPPQALVVPKRRKGDRLVVAGEEYTIVDITQNEVTLSAKSNNKRTTIRYTPGT